VNWSRLRVMDRTSLLSPAPEAADPTVTVEPGNLFVTDSSTPESFTNKTAVSKTFFADNIKYPKFGKKDVESEGDVDSPPIYSRQVRRSIASSFN
jgi:hypothetical protein